MAISVLVAAWIRTVFDLMTVGCFPFFVLMFFSGTVFPLPQVRLFEFGSHQINLTDVLPTTHSMAAYSEVMNRGAGVNDLIFEMVAIVLLSAAFYAVGTWILTIRHMRARNA